MFFGVFFLDKFGLAHGGDGGRQRRRQRRQCATATAAVPGEGKWAASEMGAAVTFMLSGIALGIACGVCVSGDVSCEEI